MLKQCRLNLDDEQCESKDEHLNDEHETRKLEQETENKTDDEFVDEQQGEQEDEERVTARFVRFSC
jgi:hypothetical protein